MNLPADTAFVPHHLKITLTSNLVLNLLLLIQSYQYLMDLLVTAHTFQLAMEIIMSRLVLKEAIINQFKKILDRSYLRLSYLVSMV